MAIIIISHGVYSIMIMSDAEREALKEHISCGLAALNQREFDEKLQRNITSGLDIVKSTYKELTHLEADNYCYAKLIEDTLQAFADRDENSTLRYREYLSAVVKLVEDMMIVISLTYCRTPGSYTCISERYDTLLNFENKISNTLANS